MTIAAKLAAPSFFDHIPPHAMPVVQKAWDRARERGDAGYAYLIKYIIRELGLELAEVGTPDVPYIEAYHWIEEVRGGKGRPGGNPAPILPETTPLQLVSSCDAVDRAMKAYAIVAQALKLQETMIAGGYSPESCDMQDMIVAEAIKEWLTSEAGDWSEAMNLDYSPGEIAMRLLDTKDGDQNTKLLDMFATYMQAELCQAIVHGRQEGGAA